MDVDVSRWVLEFLLRQPVDDWLLNNVVCVLPLTNDNSNLKKALLLRKIESEIAKGSVSEKVLVLLERIEQLEYEEGVVSSVAMKAAYCAVAVDCAVRFLDESEEGKYFDAVKRIWRDRVSTMEMTEDVGLVSDELRSWKDEIEAGVWDASVCENLRMKNRGKDALEIVKAYIAEAWESMDPSFLEFVARTVTEDTMRNVLGAGNNHVCDQVGEKAAAVLPDSYPDMVVSDDKRELQRGVVVRRRKHVAVKRSKGAISGTSRGAKITDSEELDTRISPLKYDCLPTPETNKVQEALRTSSMELQAAVTDPLPDAVQMAENVISSMGGENMNQEPPVGQDDMDVDAPNPLVGMSAEAAPANDTIIDIQCCRTLNDVPKPSLMSRNSTARTCEWDDSLDALPEESADCGSSLHLPTPKSKVVSPLKTYEIPKFARKRKKWSTLEEDTLRTGVQKYGKGNWKLILKSYGDIFEERTEVDLKDKWRNMIRW